LTQWTILTVPKPSPRIWIPNLEDATPEELRAALSNVVRSYGVSDLANRSGITQAGIYKALGEDGNPSFETIRSILAAVGLRLSVAPAKGAMEAA
jgi:probable addiction module antidote protein